MDKETKTRRRQLLSGTAISPRPLTGNETVADLIDNAFLACHAGRLRDGARLCVDGDAGSVMVLDPAPGNIEEDSQCEAAGVPG